MLRTLSAVGTLREGSSSWDQMDMMSLDCCDASVEMIVDKGSIDALMCTGSSQGNVQACVAEFLRVLVPGGTYFVVTGQSRTQSFLCAQSGRDWAISRTETTAQAGRRPFTVIMMQKKERCMGECGE